MGSAAVQAAIDRHHAISPYCNINELGYLVFLPTRKAGRHSRNFATDVFKTMPGGMALRIPKAVHVALRKRTYNHQRRQPNVGLNSVGRRTDELDLYVDWSRYFFHVGGECRPDTGRLPDKQRGDNSGNICLPSTVLDTGRKVSIFRGRLPVLNRFGVECRGRDFGQIAAYRSYALDAMKRMRSEGEPGRSSAVHDLGFLWALNPTSNRRRHTSFRRAHALA